MYTHTHTHTHTHAGQKSPAKDLGPAPLVDTEALEAQRLRKQQQLMEIMESQGKQQMSSGAHHVEDTPKVLLLRFHHVSAMKAKEKDDFRAHFETVQLGSTLCKKKSTRTAL